MNIVLLIIAAVVALLALFIFYRLIAVKLAQHKRANTELKRMLPLYTALNKNELSSDMIYKFAKDPLTREFTFNALKEYNKSELFPEEFFTVESGAEAKLVRWLEFPTELGKSPDEIEYDQKVTFEKEGEILHYHVFKFKTYEPHWAAKDGWNRGVVGPYWGDSKPYTNSTSFSRIGSPLSAQEEAEWLHNNIIIPRNLKS